MRATLHSLRGLSARGSRLALDYLEASVLRSSYEPCERIMASTRATGEPLVWGVEGGEAAKRMQNLRSFLATCGYELEGHSKPCFVNLLEEAGQEQEQSHHVSLLDTAPMSSL